MEKYYTKEEIKTTLRRESSPLDDYQQQVRGPAAITELRREVQVAPGEELPATWGRGNGAEAARKPGHVNDYSGLFLGKRNSSTAAAGADCRPPHRPGKEPHEEQDEDAAKSCVLVDLDMAPG